MSVPSFLRGIMPDSVACIKKKEDDRYGVIFLFSIH